MQIPDYKYLNPGISHFIIFKNPMPLIYPLHAPSTIPFLGLVQAVRAAKSRKGQVDKPARRSPSGHLNAAIAQPLLNPDSALPAEEVPRFMCGSCVEEEYRLTS